MKYRKKPVVIEAWRYPNYDFIWSPDSNAPDWILEALKNNVIVKAKRMTSVGFVYWHFIQTLEGEMKITNGDYIIRGVQGELYPCKPDIFEASYELVQS